MSSHARLHLSAVSLAVAAAFSIAASAQEAVTTEDVMVTAGRVEQELQDVNMSVTVITAEDIAHSPARSVGELLEDVAGVRIDNDGGQGIKRVHIRGEDAFRSLIMIDGQKISEHKSMNGAPLMIDPSAIERIEVIKGPASVLYGSDAIGGVINIITKKGGQDAFGADVSAGFSTSSSAKDAAASVYGALDGWKYRLSASVMSSDNIDTPYGEMDNTYFNSHSFGGFLSYDISEDITVGASLDYYDFEFGSTSVELGDDYDDFAVDVPNWERAKLAVFGEARNIGSVLTRVRADAFYQKNNKDMTNTIVTSGVTVQPIGINDMKQYGFSLQADWQLCDSSYLVTGYEFNYDDLDATTKVYNSMMAMLGNYSSYYAGLYPGGYVSNKTYDGWQMTNAVFASLETSLPHDFTLNLGVRYTWVDSSVDYVNNNDGTSGSYEDQSDGKAVFNVGLLWNGIDGLTLRANYAQGYRNPILSELYIGTQMGQTSTSVYGNPDLKPETSDNFEIGLRYNRPGLNIDLAAFYNEADDYIATIYRESLAGYQYSNISSARTYGVELSARAQVPGTGFWPHATLTFIRRQYDDGEGFKTWKTAIPKFYGRAGVKWTGEYSGLALRADAYARFQTATKYRSSDGEDDYDLGGFATFNLTGGVSFGPKKQYSFDAGLYNIFDKGYRTQTAIYEPGRYFTLKLGARF